MPGTLDSAFSLRVQEEREILGFHRNSTFSALCVRMEAGSDRLCEPTLQPKMVYTKEPIESDKKAKPSRP